MNMSRPSHRGSVDGNGQVRRVDQRRLVPISVRQRGQTTARKLSRPRRIVDLRSEAARMIELICELFPVCRSITGDGLRQSLFRLGELIPLETHEVASGTQVFDWTIPKEWNIKDGYIKDAGGSRVVDFRVNNLHVVNYSGPVNGRMSFGELRPHLHSLPEHPDWIPYRTTYYEQSWGFCLSHRQLESLADAEYEVMINSSLGDGALTYGECVLPGQVEEEFLISNSRLSSIDVQ